MIDHLWTILCARCIVESKTNSVSLIDVLHCGQTIWGSLIIFVLILNIERYAIRWCSWGSVSNCGSFAGAEHDLDNTAKPANRAAPPVCCDSVPLEARQGLDPAVIEAAFGGEICGHGRQQRVEITGSRFRESDDPEAVA